MHAAAMFLIHDTCMQISINIPSIYKYYFMHVMCMHAGQAHCMLIKTTEMFKKTSLNISFVLVINNYNYSGYQFVLFIFYFENLDS